MQACGGFAREQRSAGGRANREATVGTCVVQTFRSESIEIWGVMIGASVASEIIDSEVIGQDKHDVRRCGILASFLRVCWLRLGGLEQSESDICEEECDEGTETVGVFAFEG